MSAEVVETKMDTATLDTATLARRARLSLAQALEAMQAPEASGNLLSVAEPLAKAMGLCIQMEAGGGSARSAHNVSSLLGLVREALKLLQLPENQTHSALVERATAAVAEALGAAHELSQAVAGAAAPNATPPSPQAVDQRNPAIAEARSRAEAPRAKGEAANSAAGNAAAGNAAAGNAAAHSDAVDSTVDPIAESRQHSIDGVLHVEAALGAHSASNFYKGLSGNDIISGGGIFIATYQVPPVGQRLKLKVSLPGGYEFDAQGVVVWAREAAFSATVSGAPPGFGARLTDVSAEGLRLIQRYTRNREPLFHEDL